MRESIRHLVNKIKLIMDFVNKDDVFVVLIIIFATSASFGLGRISSFEENDIPLQIASANLIPKNNEIIGNYVASKNGTKYHLPWCSGAQTINDANKIWFETREEAESRGYTPAKNCKGL
ncbi:MAG: hypothetical protein PHX25_00475 [Candidatus Pacebacteria bacterium]|nr:hypothetical protein [Candidatus Paceibacterota bacterium]